MLGLGSWAWAVVGVLSIYSKGNGAVNEIHSTSHNPLIHIMADCAVPVIPS